MTRFREMWEHQRNLMAKMEAIEAENGLLEFVGIVDDLDHPRQQAKLRHMAWWIVEEVSEVVDCADVHARVEEVADVLHWHIEMMIVAGIELDGGTFDLFEVAFRDQLYSASRTFAWASFVNHLGMTMHELKNRPWKLARRSTDVATFRKKMTESLLHYFVAAVQKEGIELDHLYEAYFTKNEINHTRCQTQTQDMRNDLGEEG